MGENELTESHRGDISFLDIGRLVQIIIHSAQLVDDSTHVVVLLRHLEHYGQDIGGVL